MSEKKKPSLMIAFGMGPKKGPDSGEDDEKDEGDSDSYELVKQACREFFEAAGIEPKDEDAACEALHSFVTLSMTEEKEEE